MLMPGKQDKADKPFFKTYQMDLPIINNNNIYFLSISTCVHLFVITFYQMYLYLHNLMYTHGHNERWVEMGQEFDYLNK